MNALHFTLVSALGTPQAQPQAGAPYAATLEMAARLKAYVATIDPDSASFLSAQRVTLFRERTEEAAGKPREAILRGRFATELLQSGKLDEALAELDRADAAIERLPETDREATRADLERTRILTWLRRGEVDNCLERHCCASCIVPITAGGTHSVAAGSETAIRLLLAALAREPDDHELRWWLNLAHMTLGTWPDGVPESFRIAADKFASGHDLPRFPDVAAACGVAVSTLSGGASIEDFDRDGFLDLMTCSIGFDEPMHFFRANGDGTFADRSVEAGVAPLTGGLNLLHADYDNDGWTDVFVLRGAWFDEWGAMPNSLLRNRGDGTFEDVTVAAGVLSFHPTQTGQFADFDGDGWLDLVIGNETQKGLRHPCELFLNRRDGTFVDVAAAVGSDLVAFVKAVAVGDYDDDGRPDLFFSRRGLPNVLLRNVADARPNGPGFRFIDVSRAAGISGPLMSFPCWFFDDDNDGDQDLFVATNNGFGGTSHDEIGKLMSGKTPTGIELPVLYRNLGNGRFRSVPFGRAILSMGSNYGDFDNDGWLDVYLGNGAPSFGALLPNKAFRNDGAGKFQDVTTAAGLGHLQKGHAVAFADLDNDGDQDLFCEVGGFFSDDAYPNVLFENPGSGNRWVTLQLEGVKANRSAIGARVRVDFTTASGARTVHHVCGTGGSFGASSLQLEIGLADAVSIEKVTIRWPGSGTVQELAGPGLDATWRIREDASAFEPVARKVVKLGGGER
jgi:hypothetical protein